MTRLIAKEDRNAPEHTKRLYRAGGLDSAHIRRLPTELIEDFGDGLFRPVVVATNEHRRLAAFELGIDHQRIADGTESLDEARAFKFALQSFHKRFVEIGEKLQHANRELI